MLRIIIIIYLSRQIFFFALKTILVANINFPYSNRFNYNFITNTLFSSMLTKLQSHVGQKRVGGRHFETNQMLQRKEFRPSTSALPPARRI